MKQDKTTKLVDIMHYYQFNKLDISTLTDEQIKYLITERKKQIFDAVSNFINGKTNFNLFLDSLSEENLYLFLSYDTIEAIKTSKKRDIIIKAIVFSHNKYLIEVLKESLFLDYIIQNFDYLSAIIENMPNEIAITIFDSILKKYPRKIKAIIQFNAVNQSAIIEHIGLDKFYLITKKEQLLIYLADDVISNLIMLKPFCDLFLQLPTEQIIEVLERIIVPNSFSYNKEFIRKIATLKDPNQYRFLVDTIMDRSYNNIRRVKTRKLKNMNDYFVHKKMKEDLLITKQHLRINDIVLSNKSKYRFDPFPLEEAREKYYDYQVEQIKACDGLLAEYYDFYCNPRYNHSIFNEKNIFWRTKINDWLKSNEDKSFLYEILSLMTTKKLFEILIDRYYKDVAYNFLLNLQKMVTFFDSIDIDKIENISLEFKERLKKYKLILKFDYLTRDEQIAFYNSFDKKTSYSAIFYDDYNLAKRMFYENMNNSVFHPNQKSSLLIDENTSNNEVKIYELKGEPFYTYTHITPIKRREAHKTSELWNNYIFDYLTNPLGASEKKLTTHITFASSYKLESFKLIKEFVTFGFYDLDIKRIIRTFSCSSSYPSDCYGLGIDKVNEILPTLDKNNLMKDYNGIIYQNVSSIILDDVILQKYRDFKPDFLYCYDKVTMWDINIAKRMGIDILVVYTDNYLCQIGNYSHYDFDDEYMMRLSQTQKICTYQKKKIDSGC